jgi:dynein heavy chain
MKDLTAMCLEDFKTKLERTKIETLVTIHVHQVGVYGKILEEVKAGRIKEASDFEW